MAEKGKWPRRRLTVAHILEETMTAKGLSTEDVASRCKASFQTVKNILDGKSISARIVRNLINELGWDKDPEVLKDVLLGTLALYFEDDGELNAKAGLWAK